MRCCGVALSYVAVGVGGAGLAPGLGACAQKEAPAPEPESQRGWIELKRPGEHRLCCPVHYALQDRTARARLRGTDDSDRNIGT